MRDGRDNGYRHGGRGVRRDRLDEHDIQAELEDYFDLPSPGSPPKGHMHDKKSYRSFSRSPTRRDRHRLYERRRSRTPSPRSRSRDRYSRRSRRGGSRSRSRERERERYARRDDAYANDYRRDKRDEYRYRREHRSEDKGYYRSSDPKGDYRKDGSRYESNRSADKWVNRGEERDPTPRKNDPHLLAAPPPPPPPAETFPRSPDISAELTSLAKSQDLSFDSINGVQDSGLLYSRLSHLESLLLGPKPDSWREQEEQCRLLRLKVGMCSKNEGEKEPFSKDILPEVEPTGKLVDVPYEAHQEVKDPRSDFLKEYELMSAWVMKPRALPGFAEETLKQSEEPNSPTHSWSTSPKRITSNLDRNTQKAGIKEERQTTVRSASIPLECMENQNHSNADRNMELEEGFFNVRLLNGQEYVLQYGEIVDLIRKGDLPDGWPAYRDADSLWVSVSSKDGVYEKPKKESADVTGDSVVLDMAKECDIKDIQHWIKDKSKLADKALKSKKCPVILQYTRGRDSRSHTPSEVKREFDFKEEAKIASESLSDYQHIISMRRHGRILCGTPKPVKPATMAMIKGYILSDRSKLRDIATGALQKALKSILDDQRGQTPNKR